MQTNSLIPENTPPQFLAYMMIGVLIFLSVILYYKGVTPSFSADDYVHLEKNVFFENTVDAFSVFTEFDGREYRPLVRFSLWVNSNMSTSALSFRATNVLVHVLCVSLVFYIFLSITKNLSSSFAGAMFFALLPIHSASINFIMGRTDLICAFFYLLTILLFLIYSQKKKKRVLLASFISFLFTIFSKEMAVSLPIILSTLVFLESPEKTMIKRSMESIQTTIVFWSMTFIYLLIRIMSWAGDPQSVTVYTHFSVKHIIKNFFMWFFALIYPFDLYQARTFSENNLRLFGGALLLSLCMILLFVIFTIGKNRILTFIRNKFFILGTVWFFATLAPVMGGGAHRWYLYLPSISLSFIVLSIFGDAQENKKKVLYIVFSIYLGLASVQTIYRTNIWSKQNVISYSFFNQIEKYGLQDIKKYYFVNIPFGYKSAYLYTFQSLESALFLKYGKKPEIIEVSHFNLSDKDNLKVTRVDDKLKFNIEINNYSFFCFNYVQRYFPELAKFNKGDLSVSITKLSKSKLVERYEVCIPDDLKIPVFYFDGDKIVKW